MKKKALRIGWNAADWKIIGALTQIINDVKDYRFKILLIEYNLC